MAVRLCPQLAHIVLVLVGDWYFWRLGKLVVGKNATSLAAVLLIFNRPFQEVQIRCFVNGLEAIFGVVSFYFFTKVSNKFDINLIMLTGTLTLSFVVRCTSPLAWIAVILIKIVVDRSIKSFIMAALFVFLPLLTFSVALDSYYFGEFPVFTALNFLKINVLEAHSNFFGIDPWEYYLKNTFVECFSIAYPFLIVFFIYSIYKQVYRHHVVPYIPILVISYVTAFSLVPHKEGRFIQPVIPFLFLILAQGIEKFLILGHRGNEIRRRAAKLSVFMIIAIYMTIHLTSMISHHTSKFRKYEVPLYLLQKEHSAHSIYYFGLGQPHYTWAHRRTYNDAYGSNNRT